jgi:hypothetical protein
MTSRPSFDPIVCIVGFHHARYATCTCWENEIIYDLKLTNTLTYRGPDVESWIGVEEGSDPATENDWPLLPFMALADGAHSYNYTPHRSS